MVPGSFPIGAEQGQAAGSWTALAELPRWADIIFYSVVED
jgi:hypothetical protein